MQMQSFPFTQAMDVRVSEDELTVDLADGRTISVPLLWFPRLCHGTRRERKQWQLIGGGEGIHWPDLDEDISVEGLLTGRPSGQSQVSLQKWLESRGTAAKAKQNPKTKTKRK
jgi:hypothetical protein